MTGVSNILLHPETPPLLERAELLRELQGHFSTALAGQGGVVLLGGNAGIGKTALIREFARQVGDQTLVLAGACDALATREPLAPLYDIAADAGLEAQILLDSVESRLARFRAFLAILEDAQRPCLAILEDVHWADAATLDLLRFISRRIEGTRALIVATYRNDEVGPEHPLRVVLGDLAMLGTSHRLTVPPLSQEAVTQLTKGQEIDPVELHRLTGGNPFFVTEVIAAGAAGIPATVRDAVLARAARLSPDARSTLDAAAVLGSPGEVWLLARVLEPGRNALDECVSAGMLAAHNDSFSFRHEIARQAILSSIPSQRGKLLHERAIEGLERAVTDRSMLARLAHHAAAVGRRDAVLRYAPAAARAASRLSAHREAAAQFERALRFAGNMPKRERAQLLEDYAQECHLTERLEESIRARHAAVKLWREMGESLREGVDLARLARVLVLAGRNTAAEEASQAAINVLEAQLPGAELATAYQIQAHLRMLNRDNAEAIERGLQAIALAGRHGAQEALIYAHNTVGSAMMLSNQNEGRTFLERSVQMALEAGLDDYAASAYGNLGSASGEIYAFEQADRFLAEGIAFCEERDLDFERNYMQAWLALSHLHQGRWKQATDVAAALLRLPRLSAISRIMAQVALGRVRARRGDPEVMVALDAAHTSARQTATLQRLGPVHAARAEAAWLSGSPDQARAEARAVYDLAIRQRHPWFIGELAYWRWKAGDLDAPPQDAAQPYALQISGDWAGAARHWRELNCPYEAARALAESGDEAALRSALEEFDALGANPAKTAVTRQLKESGAKAIPRGARPTTRANPAGLTTRQVQVAQLLTRGLTNAEIAARLYISPKTVESHISALFSKLDVSNRVDAARELERLGVRAPN